MLVHRTQHGNTKLTLRTRNSTRSCISSRFESVSLLVFALSPSVITSGFVTLMENSINAISYRKIIKYFISANQNHSASPAMTSADSSCGLLRSVSQNSLSNARMKLYLPSSCVMTASNSAQMVSNDIAGAGVVTTVGAAVGVEASGACSSVVLLLLVVAVLLLWAEPFLPFSASAVVRRRFPGAIVVVVVSSRRLCVVMLLFTGRRRRRRRRTNGSIVAGGQIDLSSQAKGQMAGAHMKQAFLYLSVRTYPARFYF